MINTPFQILITVCRTAHLSGTLNVLLLFHTITFDVAVKPDARFRLKISCPPDHSAVDPDHHAKMRNLVILDGHVFICGDNGLCLFPRKRAIRQ